MKTKTIVRYHLTTIRMAIIKKINVCEGVEKSEHSYIADGNLNDEKHYGGLPPKIKNRTNIMIQQSHLWVHTKKSEARNLKHYAFSCSL